MNTESKTAKSLSQALGERLKQARLNSDISQNTVADLAGVSRKVVINAEKGKGQLEAFVAIMMALKLTEQLNTFLPKQEISPIQLSKLQGKQRQRASAQKIKDKELSAW
ncbi:MAG: helix-turn-helix domain-containing protein [Spongiibacteraceae bacterium]|nr:helix-turn-helix domain-containing protein [Spongiibacteraceae bacterium]